VDRVRVHRSRSSSSSSGAVCGMGLGTAYILCCCEKQQISGHRLYSHVAKVSTAPHTVQCSSGGSSPDPPVISLPPVYLPFNGPGQMVEVVEVVEVL